MLEISCGTIPYTVKDGTIYYLLIKNKNGGDCGFPKGHIEAGETEQETALRETWEETSVKPMITNGFRHEISYRMNNGNEKTVVYFLADFKDQVPMRNKDFEDFTYMILPFDKAYAELTFESAKTMLKAANDFLTKDREHWS